MSTVDSDVDVVDDCETNIKAFVCDVAVTDVINNYDSVEHCNNSKPLSTDLATLRYLPVNVTDSDGNKCLLNGLDDSGAEICLVNRKAVSSLNLTKVGTVVLSGAIGGNVNADLVRLFMSSADYPTESIGVVCAVCDSATHPLILNSEVVNKLQQLRIGPIVAAVINSDCSDGERIEVDSLSGETETSADVQQQTDIGHAVGDDMTNCDNSSIQSLIAEQLDDESLRGCLSLVKRGKGNLFYKHGVLYRLDRFAGQTVEQLVLPTGRRQQAMALAHQTFGGHMAVKSTCNRLRYSFWWPTVTCDVKSFVGSCDRCVKRARVTVFDRVPIKSIERNDEAFNHWWIDVAGPLFPNQKVEYNYFLVACDNQTRWPAAFCLRSVTAKSICDCLIKLWSMFGVSQFVSMDNAAYNTAQLTKVLMDKMGCSPIFITPGHSSGNSLAERSIGTLKELIHKVAYDHQKSWWKYLDYVLWAMREVPHSSTGIAPWTLAFGGRVPKGPCAILQKVWMGDIAVPPNLSSSIVQYMQELRDRLAAAKQYADNHLQHEQSRWVNRYNLRSRDKQFVEGESVMILTPDSTSSRLWSRWRAPAKIISKQSDYSYLVEYNGSRLVMHANKLRPYKVRVDAVQCNSLMFVNESECVDTGVNTCSVIYDEDVDFGPVKVVEPSTRNEPLPSTKIDPARLAHLTEQQRIELLAVLDKYPQVFSETPGYCGQVVHQIIVSDNFKPKRCKPYRIPEKLKPEVDRQIQELEKLGFIEKSNTPMTSSLVCLIKKDKSVRCVVDYRYVNLYTLPDALGPPDAVSYTHLTLPTKRIV